MTKQEIIEIFLDSDVIKKWHFFKYHFEFYFIGSEHILAKSIVEAIVDIENKIPNAGKDYIKKITSINDKPNHTKHFEQLLQVLAELTMVHKAVTNPWEELISIEYEPSVGSTDKNPELTVKTKYLYLGIEVKSPELVSKNNERATKPYQLPSRSSLIDKYDKDEIMLPRDNPVKDYLISANEKFKNFKNIDSDFYSTLIIVWDDFIYEPISALTSPQAGLFTKNSFAKNEKDEIMLFENVDCVIITRHLLPIVRGTRDEPLPDHSMHPLDYGRHDEFPFKVYIPNPNSKLTAPIELLKCFQAIEPSSKLGAEYLPTDWILWFNK